MTRSARLLLPAALVALTAVLLTGSVGDAATGRATTSKHVLSTWLPYWDGTAGLDQVLAHADRFRFVSPFWYQADGATTITAHPGAGNASWVSELHAAGVAVVPTVTESFQGATAATIFNSERLRALHERTLVNLVVSHGYDGIDLDYERMAVGVPATENNVRSGYATMVSELCAKLRALHRRCDVTVPSKTSDVHTGAGWDTWAYDYAALGTSATRLRLMIYDQHGPWGAPGPIAGSPWVRAVLDFAVSQVPRTGKLEMGVPTYGYDWAKTGNTTVMWDQARALIVARHLTPTFDPVQQEPYFHYRKSGVFHTVWYENARSLAAKVAIANHYHVGTMGFWYIGHQSPADWLVLSRLAL